jgi:hypothetical protein
MLSDRSRVPPAPPGRPAAGSRQAGGAADGVPVGVGVGDGEEVGGGGGTVGEGCGLLLLPGDGDRCGEGAWVGCGSGGTGVKIGCVGPSSPGGSPVDDLGCGRAPRPDGVDWPEPASWEPGEASAACSGTAG